MAEPANTFNDGGIKFSRQTFSALDVTPTTPVSVTYILKKGSIKAGSERVVSKDQNGNEYRQAFNAKIRSGSITAQFTGQTDLPPERFQVITVQDTSGIARNLIIAEVDQEFSPDGEAMLTLSVYEQMHPGTGAPEPG